MRCSPSSICGSASGSCSRRRSSLAAARRARSRRRNSTYLLTGLRERLDLSRLHEWTLEMNPATVSLEKATALRELGVSRISMGVQSWDDALLKVLGRVHHAAQAERSYEILREAGFTNVNLDFMFAVPTQTREQWRSTLEKTIALAPEHISAYCLTYEEDTSFYQRFQSGEYRPDEGWDADLFELTMDLLGGGGYAQYEISNYARPGRECDHNLAYWTARDYLGLGPSAFSTAGARRWQNVPDTTTYTARIAAGHARGVVRGSAAARHAPRGADRLFAPHERRHRPRIARRVAGGSRGVRGRGLPGAGARSPGPHAPRPAGRGYDRGDVCVNERPDRGRRTGRRGLRGVLRTRGTPSDAAGARHPPTRKGVRRLPESQLLADLRPPRADRARARAAALRAPLRSFLSTPQAGSWSIRCRRWAVVRSR